MVSIAKKDALFCDAVDVRSLADFIAVSTQGMGSLIVCEDEEKVRPVRGASPVCRKREQERGKQESGGLEVHRSARCSVQARCCSVVVLRPSAAWSRELIAAVFGHRRFHCSRQV